MPGEDINTTLRFDADITDFGAAMQEARRAASLAKSEFNAVSSGMDDWSSSTTGLTSKLKQLSAQQQVEERRLEVLQAAYDKVVAEQGENSKAAVDLKTKINNQVAAVNKATAQHDKFAEKLADVENDAKDAEDGVEKAGKAAKKSGEDAEAAGGGWTIMKDVIADFVSNIISGAVDAILGAAEATREYRRELALMQQNATDAGVDMDTMKGKLADVTAVTGDTGAAMEGLNMLMASGLSTDEIVLASDALAGAASKFDGVSFEAIAEGLQETLATGTGVGAFAEIIERTGGNIDDFNAGLEGCSTAAERQQYVMQWLSDSGLKGVHDAYVQNNADLVAAEQAQFRYNDSMAQIGAALEPIQTALTNLGSTIAEKVAPVIESIVTWVMDNLPVIEPIVIGIATALGVLAAALAIQGIINGVSKAFAFLNSTMLANPIVLIVAAIAGLVAAFVGLWNNCEAFRNFWLKMWEGIKQAFAKVVDWLKKAASNISTFFSNAWQGIKNVWAGVTNFFSNIREGINRTFANVGSWFMEKFTSAKNLAQNAWSGVTNFFSNVREGINRTFANVGNWFKEKFTAAKNLVQNAWSGVKGYFSNVKNGITNAFSNVDKWMSNKFGASWTAIKNKFSNSIVGQYFGQIWNSIKGTFSAVKSVLSGNFSDAWQSIKGVFSGWGSFFSGLWDNVKNIFSGVGSWFSNIGQNLVSGLWSGISNSFQWIKDKITGWVGDVLGFVKGLFGIHSPSTETEWQGEMLVAGYVNALKNGRRKMAEAMRGFANSGLDALGDTTPEFGGTAGVGGKTINYYQTINSPKSLTRGEIYRRTHNALSAVGGA